MASYTDALKNALAALEAIRDNSNSGGPRYEMAERALRAVREAPPLEADEELVEACGAAMMDAPEDGKLWRQPRAVLRLLGEKLPKPKEAP